jgi:hypothetical protein
MNIFKTIFNLGNIRTALEKTYGALSVAIVVTNNSIEEMKKTTTPSKNIKDLEDIVKLMTTIMTVVGKILYVIGGTIAPVVGANTFISKAKSEVQKQIDELNGLKL